MPGNLLQSAMPITKRKSLLKEISRIASRLSEEAIVVLAFLATFAYALYLGNIGTATFSIHFAALVGYLSVRLVKLVR